MAKFHINKHGVPAPCKAKPGNCPLGGDETHFGSREEAQEAINKINEEKHGLLSEMREKTKENMKVEVWMEDKKTGIQCGLNRYGELFLGNSESGYNLPDTPENRERVINDFCRITGRQRPVIMANGKPYKGKETMIDFSR